MATQSRLRPFAFAAVSYVFDGTPFNVATLLAGPIAALRARIAALPALIRVRPACSVAA